MPIYAYRCDACGHAKDVLQKMSDPVLTTCPSCGAESFSKQVTAAGFQLKGSGWYVTDFRGGNAGKASADAAATSPASPAGADGGKPATGDSGSGSDSGSSASGSASGGSGSSESSGSSGGSASASAAGCGTSCACH